MISADYEIEASILRLAHGRDPFYFVCTIYFHGDREKMLIKQLVRRFFSASIRIFSIFAEYRMFGFCAEISTRSYPIEIFDRNLYTLYSFAKLLDVREVG